jgi:hypothetical protein
VPAAAAPPKTAKKENAFTRKIGPLPMWVWLAIIGGAVLVWAFYESKKSASQSASSTTSASTQPPEIVQLQGTPTNVTVNTPPEQSHNPPAKSTAKQVGVTSVDTPTAKTPVDHHSRKPTRTVHHVKKKKTPAKKPDGGPARKPATARA